jgi:hypothetical protein
MNAEKELGRMLNDEFESDVFRELFGFVENDEELIRVATDRLDNEWFRKSNKWTHEMIHKATPKYL